MTNDTIIPAMPVTIIETMPATSFLAQINNKMQPTKLSCRSADTYHMLNIHCKKMTVFIIETGIPVQWWHLLRYLFRMWEVSTTQKSVLPTLLHSDDCIVNHTCRSVPKILPTPKTLYQKLCLQFPIIMSTLLFHNGPELRYGRM